MGQTPETIFLRLEELRKFQIEKQNLLLEKQNAQRQLLNQEQQQLYEMFGLSVSKLSISDQSSSCNEPGSPYAVATTSDMTRNEVPASRRSKPDKQNPSVTPSPVPAAPSREITKDNSTLPKRPFLKRNQGLTNRFKIDPSVLRLENLPKYKYAGAHRSSKFFREFVPTAAKRKQYRRQKPSTQPADLKLNPMPDVDNTPSRSTDEFEALEECENDDSETFCPLVDDDMETSRTQCSDEPLNPTTWAAVLNTEAAARDVQPIQSKSITSLQNTPIREKIRNQQKHLDELNIFELLERETKATATSSSNIENSQPSIPVGPITNATESSSITIDDTLESEDAAAIRESCHVRFADAVHMTEFEDFSDAETVHSIDGDNIHSDQTSTPIHQFRQFGALKMANRPQSPSNLDLLAKSDQMKAKLAELEREIALFRTNNAEITKSKQSHEVERVKLAEERIEMEQMLTDERIRLEVVLHDERMRLADERMALERRAKEMRAPNRKEREEVVGLREQVTKLEREVLAKEQKHIAAQARLRAQIRTMDKDLKDYSYEIEQLKKETKRLDAENVRLRRQGTNKMLSEINRNIAKLSSCANAEESSAKTTPDKTILAKKRTQSVPDLSKQRKSLPMTIIAASDSDDSEPDAHEPERCQPAAISNVIVPATATASQDNEQTSCKREILNEDGSKDVWYPNGNIKKISADTMLIRMLYYNKDINETNIGEGTVKYYYAATNTWHTSYLDGLEILEFPNGQTEHRHKDGRVDVYFANGSIRMINPHNEDVAEEWRYPDGSVTVTKMNGDKVLSMPNGQREIHTAEHKRREYPDGTMKIVYPDGSQETRYSNGRIRIKDKTGQLVMDTDSTITAPK